MIRSPFKIFKRHLTTPAHLVEFFEKRGNSLFFDKNFIPKIKVISAPVNSGSILVEVNVDESLCNINNSIHGGAIASLIDGVSTAVNYTFLQIV
jgi:hypothetical protein